MFKNDPDMCRLVLQLPDGKWIAPWLYIYNEPLHMFSSTKVREELVFNSQEHMMTTLDDFCKVFALDVPFMKAIESGLKRRLQDEEEAAPF